MSGSVGKKAAALVASDTDKKRLAEKSFTSYVRAVQLMPNKEVLTYRNISLLVARTFGFYPYDASLPVPPSVTLLVFHPTTTRSCDINPPACLCHTTADSCTVQVLSIRVRVNRLLSIPLFHR